MIKYQKRALKYYFEIGVSLERWAFISSCTVTAQGNHGRKHQVQVSWQRKTSLHTKVCVANWTYINTNSSVKIQNRSCDQHFTHHHTKKPKTKLKLGSEKVYTPETKHCRGKCNNGMVQQLKGYGSTWNYSKSKSVLFPQAKSNLFFFTTTRTKTSHVKGQHFTGKGPRKNTHWVKRPTQRSHGKGCYTQELQNTKSQYPSSSWQPMASMLWK